MKPSRVQSHQIARKAGMIYVTSVLPGGECHISLVLSARKELRGGRICSPYAISVTHSESPKMTLKLVRLSVNKAALHTGARYYDPLVTDICLWKKR